MYIGDKKVIDEFNSIVIQNDIIISKRCSIKYFSKIGKEQLWNDWHTLCGDLLGVYKKISYVIYAIRDNNSLEIPLCQVCNKNPRKIVCNQNNKRELSKYCSSACGNRCPEKVFKMILSRQNYSEEKSQQIKHKREATMLERFGVKYNSQREDVKQRNVERSRVDSDIYQKLTDRDWVEGEYIINKKSLSEIADELGIYYGTVGEYVRNHGFKIHHEYTNSVEQNKIRSFLDSLGVPYIENCSDVISPKHLDFYLPEYNIAIEVNGLYWHGESKKSPTYQKNKTTKCHELGILLLNFYCYEINNKFDIVKSIIKNHVDKSNEKFWARKCTIKHIDKNTEKVFMEQNHIQGYVPSTVCYGLEYDGEIISVMSFINKNRYNSSIKYDWELLRFCSKLGCNVIGGMSKLINAFVKENSPKKLLSYCDYSRSHGESYIKNGFELLHISEPSYYWYKGNVMVSRYSSQKRNLKKVLGDKFNPSISEKLNMESNGYKRVWNCGNLVFIKNF